jgi:hypothetical protein
MENATLLNRLQQCSKLSEEQAVKAMVIVADYTREKFPILEGNINSFLRQELKEVDPGLLSEIFGD